MRFPSALFVVFYLIIYGFLEDPDGLVVKIEIL